MSNDRALTDKEQKVRKHSLHIIIVLMVALAVGSVGVGLLVQSNPFTHAFDAFFYNLIHRGPHFEWLDWLIYPFNFNFLPSELSPGHMPSYFYVMVLGTLIYLGIFKRSLLGWAIFCFIFGTILSMAITSLDWHFVYRERPFTVLPNEVNEYGQAAWRNYSSFPSGHTRETALYATLIAAFIPPLRIAMIVFTLFIAYSRVYIGAHYPTDVIAGLLIGFVTAKTILLVSRELQLLLQRRKGVWHGFTPQQSITDQQQS